MSSVCDKMVAARDEAADQHKIDGSAVWTNLIWALDVAITYQTKKQNAAMKAAFGEKHEDVHD